MEQVQWMPLPTLRRKGFEVLVKELGPANAIRFLHLHDEGYGDYTAERDERLKKLTPEQIEKEIEEMQQKGEF